MEKLLTIKEVAEIFGLSEITIRQWIQHNKIKSVKIGGSRRIAQSEVIKLQKGR